MRRDGRLPPGLREALASPGGRCYRHCDRPLRIRTVASGLPGAWSVRACPAGVVSVTTYTEWTDRDPTRDVLRILNRWSRPRSLVRAWDLRLASRHGPELGRPAERFLATTVPVRRVRTVYWRVYPFRGRDRLERRLFVCLRRRHASPVFFAALSTATAADCPVCSNRRAARRNRPVPRSRRR